MLPDVAGGCRGCPGAVLSGAVRGFRGLPAAAAGASGHRAGDAERLDPCGDGAELLARDLLERRTGGVAVERVDHHLPRANLADEPQPGCDLLLGGVVDARSVALAAQEHRLDDELPLEELHLLHDARHAVVGALRVVHQPRRGVEGRVELQDVVVHTAQGAAHLLAVELRGVRENRDPRRGAQLVAQAERVVDNLLEAGVERRLAVAGEGDDVGRRAVGDHAAERRPEVVVHLLAGVEAARTGVFGIPAAFAVDAVEAAELRLDGEQVDSQREAEPSRVDGAEDDVVIERSHTAKISNFRENAPRNTSFMLAEN